MTKENILFSIIGVLFGFSLGFVFVTIVNQRAAVPPVTASASAPSQSVFDLPKTEGAGAPPADGGNPQAMQAAVQAVVKQARDEPNNFDLQMQAGQLFYQISRYDEAIQFYSRANKLRPDDFKALVALGDTNFDARHYEEAERWYTAALAKNPNDVNVRTDLGSSFMERNPPDVDRAIKEFRASLERDPRHEMTLHNLVLALILKGDTAGAQETLKRLEEVNPNNPDLTGLRAKVQALQSAAK